MASNDLTFYYDVDTDKYYTYDKATDTYKEVEENSGNGGGGGGQAIYLPHKKNKKGQDQSSGSGSGSGKGNKQKSKDSGGSGKGKKDKNGKDGSSNGGSDNSQQGNQQGHKKIRIGDRGDTDAQEKERAEAEANDTGDYEQADWSDYIDATGQSVEDLLKDPDFIRRLRDSDRERKDRELDKQIAMDQQRQHRMYQNSSEYRIKVAVEELLELNNVGKELPELSYAFRNNNQQLDPDIIVQGYGLTENDFIPQLDVYFDRSGSWNEAKLKEGRGIVDGLKVYEKKHQLKINIFYFSDEIFTDYNDRRADKSTEAGPLIWEQIKFRERNLGIHNVFIMTDDDIDHQGGAELTPIELPGVVIMLFKDGTANTVVDNLRGQKTHVIKL